MPKELEDHPTISDEAAYLWRYFIELHRVRGSTGFGPSPIGYRDVQDWATVTGRAIRPWEVKAIMGADVAFMKVQAEVAANRGKPT